MNTKQRENIIILDYGFSGIQHIAKFIRSQKVFSQILSANTSPSDLLQEQPLGIILAGSENSDSSYDFSDYYKQILNLNIPLLITGFPGQQIIKLLGGKVSQSTTISNGIFELSNNSLIFSNFPNSLEVGNILSYSVESIPDNFLNIIQLKNGLCQAVSDKKGKVFIFPFNFNFFDKTIEEQVFNNFLFKICNAKSNWNIDDYIVESLSSIKEVVKNDKVILALSGGLDSSVVAALLHKAIGDQLTCIFVDNGLLRQNEFLNVLDQYKKDYKLNITGIDASNRFLDALSGISDPEEKRKIIGRIFIEIFEEQAKSLTDVKFLAQGTVYSDVIESLPSSFNGAPVKSHHNVGGLPEKLGLSLIEPMRILFKDEVRAMGLSLGLPKQTLYRHPFPGPGLAVRIIGEITKEKVATLQAADAIVMEEISLAGYYLKVWQAFPILLPIFSTGVKSNNRSYENVIAIRVVESDDAMSAKWVDLPYSLLDKMSKRIISEVPNVGRVVYDISSKPPATIEWE